MSAPSDVTPPSLVLVGCGKMGRALLTGWLAADAVASVTVIEPAAQPAELALDRRVRFSADPAAIPPDPVPDAVIFAVKPQLMAEVAPAYHALIGRGALVLSIAAGRAIAGFEAMFGAEARIIRAMPNTPAMIGRGITVCAGNARVTAADRALAGSVLGAAGAVEWVDDEALLDPVTALSGSGPAYVFLLIEAMAAAGVAAGLPEALAKRLARETVAGAGELARRAAVEADQLRRDVTSPGGTTAAALAVLMAEDGLPALLRRAILAATERSRALAG